MTASRPPTHYCGWPPAHARATWKLLDTVPKTLFTGQINGFVAALDGRSGDVFAHVEGGAGLIRRKADDGRIA